MSAVRNRGGRAPLEGKVVLVTGGARRIGAAIARRLHALGASLAVHYRTSSGEARALVDALNAVRPRSAAAFRADLLSQPALEKLVDACVRRFGRLDGLVNNASSFYPTPVGRITVREWDDLVGTNVRAPLFLSQAAAPHLRRHRGAIVNIVDIHAERPISEYVVYSLAKGALLTLTRSLALDLGPHVRVNGVSPGAILWPESGDFASTANQRDVLRRTPLRRTGAPENIAGAVEYLLVSGTYVSGQVIAVDGGRSVVL